MSSTHACLITSESPDGGKSTIVAQGFASWSSKWWVRATFMRDRGDHVENYMKLFVGRTAVDRATAWLDWHMDLTFEEVSRERQRDS